jgi:hypothetical protein
MSMLTRRLIATAMVAPLLAACGGDPEPMTLPSGGLSSEPSAPTATGAGVLDASEPLPAATPQQSATVDRPTEAATTGGGSGEKASNAAIVDAVRRYYRALNSSLASTDATAFRRMFMESCVPCVQSADIIDDVATRDWRLVGAKYTVRRIQVQDVIGITAAATVAYDVSGYRVENKSGQTESVFKPASNRVHLSLQKAGESWTVVNLVALGA